MVKIIFETEEEIKITPTPRPNRATVEAILRNALAYRRGKVATIGKDPKAGLKEQMAAELLRLWDLHGDNQT